MDWKRNFCEVMHWPNAEDIVRVDGKDRKSMLILREEVGLTREQFSHQYVSELLRGVIAACVSELDRYIHDQIACHCLSLLRRAEIDVPKELRQLKIPLLTAKKSLEKLRSNADSRPGGILKADLREVLHRDETFQSVSGVERGAKMLGLKDFWGNMVTKMDGFDQKGDIQSELRKITTRRNQIVHEADVIIQDRARFPRLRDISRAEAEDTLGFICIFVNSFDELVCENC